MADYTFPNQRVIKINREAAKSDFLGIKNTNWQSAARDLGAHATMLYLYLASNANGYNIALSPVAVRQAIGMARSTFHDQFHKLLDKGYLVPSNGNSFEFYEVPQAVNKNSQNAVSDDGLNFEECPCPDTHESSDGHTISDEDIEINNKEVLNNEGINNRLGEVKRTIQKPQVVEVVIKRPQSEGKNRPQYIEKPKAGEFVF